MPDISMCQNEDCGQKTKCFRYMARPNPYGQSYAEFKTDENGNCAYFWPTHKDNERLCKKGHISGARK